MNLNLSGFDSVCDNLAHYISEDLTERRVVHRIGDNDRLPNVLKLFLWIDYEATGAARGG